MWTQDRNTILRIPRLKIAETVNGAPYSQLKQIERILGKPLLHCKHLSVLVVIESYM